MSNATKDSPLRSMTYNSDEADVTLLSSDGTEFKVHSYMLKAHSLVLRPILCDPAFKPSPMTIDASPEDLTCFLDLMHNKPPHTISDWPQAEKVLDLIDQYECDVASERIWVVLNEKAKSEPWRVFCLASKRNSLALAKHALSCMACDVNRRQMSIHTLSHEDASKIALSYLLGLIRKLSISQYTASYSPSHFTNDWKGIAEGYAPVYPKRTG